MEVVLYILYFLMLLSMPVIGCIIDDFDEPW